MEEEETRRLATIEQLRALAHPLRMKLFYALKLEGVTTASRLAAIVQASPALVSYHLRELSGQGFVEEVADHDEDLRKRWWKSTDRGFTFSMSDFDEQPEAQIAARELGQASIENQIGKLNEFRDQAAIWGPEWAKAAFSSDSMLKLSPNQLTDMHREIEAVVARWKSQALPTTENSPQDPGALGHAEDTSTQPSENVFFFMHAVPFRQ